MGKRILNRISDITATHKLTYDWGLSVIMVANVYSPRRRPCKMNAYARNRNPLFVCHTVNYGHYCNVVVVEIRPLCAVVILGDHDEQCDIASIFNFNDLCCRPCQLAPEGHLCHSRFVNERLDEACCSTVTARCPVSKALPSNPTYIDRKICQNGSP